MSDRHARRRERLAACLRSEQVDAFLVLSEPNVTYLTGFEGDSSVLLVLRHRAILISDGRYAEQIEEECPDLEVEIRPVEMAVLVMAAGVARSCGVNRLGFEAAHLSVADFEVFQQACGNLALKPVSGRVEQLRMIKDRDEIAALREAIATAERAFTMFRAGLRLTDTEKEAADDLEANLRRCGARAASFPTIVAAGPHAAKPHHRPSATTAVGSANPLLVDWGAENRGYRSDLTRLIITGKVTPKFRSVYQSVLRAQEQAISAIRPDVRAESVDARARSLIAEAGFGRFFNHGLGHGVGLEIHEAPRVRPQAEDVLRAGMVLTVEPGIYVPGWGGVRIEDMVLVTDGGCEVLTRLPKDLESIGW